MKEQVFGIAVRTARLHRGNRIRKARMHALFGIVLSEDREIGLPLLRRVSYATHIGKLNSDRSPQMAQASSIEMVYEPRLLRRT